MSNTYCIVFFILFVFDPCLVYPMLPVSLDCPFLIAPSVFSNVYFHGNILLSPQSGVEDMEMLGVRPLVLPSEICCKRSKIFIC